MPKHSAATVRTAKFRNLHSSLVKRNLANVIFGLARYAGWPMRKLAPLAPVIDDLNSSNVKPLCHDVFRRYMFTDDA